MLWFDQPVDWDAYREVVRERFDRFCQRPVEGIAGPHWEDVELDLDLHVHRVALPSPGDLRALEAFVSDRIATPLDRSRPLWDVFLIDGFGDGAAVLTRMHHCIADGIALARVMLTLTDGAADGEFVASGGGSALRTLAHAAHETIAVVLHPRHALVVAVEDAQSVAKFVLPGSDPASPIKGAQRAAHRVAWCDPIDLWRVKRAARSLGATVNDVLVSAVTGAVAERLRAEDGVPDEVHAMVPFNLRPLDAPLPRELGNRFGLVLLSLPVGVEDPAERTLEVMRRMDTIKHGHEGAISYRILELMGLTPPLSRAASSTTSPPRARWCSPTCPGRGAGCRSPARRWPACSCGRPARAASA